MKIRFIPSTKIGKWSAWLIVAFLLFILVFNIIISSVERVSNAFTLLHQRNIPMALALVCAVVSLVTGIIAIIRSKERAISVFISSAIGFYFLFLVAGEFLFPH